MCKVCAKVVKVEVIVDLAVAVITGDLVHIAQMAVLHSFRWLVWLQQASCHVLINVIVLQLCIRAWSLIGGLYGWRSGLSLAMLRGGKG